MASMAASLASKLSYETKPKPREAPVSGSRMILGVATIMPNALKVSYSSCSRKRKRSGQEHGDNLPGLVCTGSQVV